MGAAVSNNVASAVSSVSNYVSNSTTATNSQISIMVNEIITNTCTFEGDFNIRTTATVILKSRQIVSALQDANVKNTIAQKMLQQAMSSIGSMGVGYADATNSASEFATSSSTIINSMRAASSESAFADNVFECDHSHFAGNVNINFSNSTDFLSDQTLKNTAVQTLVNNISQTVTQKATAKVAGLAGFLIALAILIGVIGYALSKPLDTKAAKYIIAAALVIGLGVVVIVLWLYSASPFFNADTTCNPFEPGSGTGCGTDCVECCINKKQVTIALAKHPPLRYAYPIFQQGDDDDPTSFIPGLLQMCIAKAGNEVGGESAGSNGGWNGANWNVMGGTGNWKADTTSKSFDVDPLPNPLVLATSSFPDPHIICPNIQGKYYKIPANNTGISQGIADPSTNTVISCTNSPSDAIAISNTAEWTTYCNNPDPRYASHARFVCCTFLGIPCDSYIILNAETPDETKEEITKGLDINNAFVFSDYSKPGSDTDAISGGGELTGLMGVCNNRLYQLHIFMGKVGWYILMGIVFIIIVYIDLKHNNAGPSGKPI